MNSWPSGLFEILKGHKMAKYIITDQTDFDMNYKNVFDIMNVRQTR